MRKEGEKVEKQVRGRGIEDRCDGLVMGRGWRRVNLFKRWGRRRVQQ